MTALPPIADLTGSAITEAQAKTWFTNLRAYLSGLFGADGAIATALAALGSIFAAGVTAKSGAYTVATTDRGTLLNCTGTWTLTLLAAATAGNGFAFSVANTGSGVITIDANASELIEGNLTITVPAGASIVLVCDGTGWVRVGQDSEIPIPIAKGGTGATTASAALTTLGVVGKDMGSANVGSVALVMRNTSGSTLSAGSTYSGSSLALVSMYLDATQETPRFSGVAPGASLSGTWRALTNGTSPASNKYATALAQRIA